MLLEEMIEQGLYQFIDYEVTDWQEAIRLSTIPLIKNGIVDEHFAQALIDAVLEYGPYIVLLPNFAMPHTSETTPGVNGSAISFMRLKSPVSFEPGNPEKDAQVFFTLASGDKDDHLKNMAGLFELLSQKSVLDKVMSATDLGDLQKIVDTLKTTPKEEKL
ncbi:MAG: PTS sugar transporter subunit IIA [Erysipelotrichaceae bacterium]|jgi:PTS system ascorbate-specific IIA component|nr:PTS sugar transporter subunit IIA [Erysipelotrichaceae bacterium]